MKSLIALAVLCAATLIASDSFAQCSRGGGGSSPGSSSGGGTLLTSPGSWSYQMMMAQAYQQQVAQQQYAYAMAKAADRAQKLEVRRSRAELYRERLAERREQVRLAEAERMSRSSYSSPRFASSQQ